MEQTTNDGVIVVVVIDDVEFCLYSTIRDTEPYDDPLLVESTLIMRDLQSGLVRVAIFLNESSKNSKYEIKK